MKEIGSHRNFENRYISTMAEFLFKNSDVYDFDSTIKTESIESVDSWKRVLFSMRALMEENKFEFASESEVEIGDDTKPTAFSRPFSLSTI